MTTQPIRLGTRGSQLALWQANHIADALRKHGHTVAVEVIRTTGDRMQDPSFVAPAAFDDGTPLDAKGIFIKEIEDALLDGRIDVAIHCLKDLPTSLDPRFTLAAIPPRADARDAFVCEDFWGLHMLPLGSRVATTSPRRQAMLLSLRPDLEFVEMRGNIDTRLRKWAAGEADALVLASAGLDRLGRTEHVHQRFSVDELCPAPGQGALALETLTVSASTLAHDGAGPSRQRLVADALSALHHEPTAFATAVERGVLASLGGGCNLPLGAYCHAADDHWHLHATVVSPDGDTVVQVGHRAPMGIPAAEFAAGAARLLEQRGARQLLMASPNQQPDDRLTAPAL